MRMDPYIQKYTLTVCLYGATPGGSLLYRRVIDTELEGFLVNPVGQCPDERKQFPSKLEVAKVGCTEHWQNIE